LFCAWPDENGSLPIAHSYAALWPSEEVYLSSTRRYHRIISHELFQGMMKTYDYFCTYHKFNFNMSKNAILKSKNAINIQVQVAVFQEGEFWVAYCPSLELSSYGEDLEDAKQAFDAALSIFLKETDRKGTLERCLLRLGWQLQMKPKAIYHQPSMTLRNSQKLLRKNPQIFNERVAIPMAV
jgi:predicted RNase H-like HicB family nuclease